MIQHCNGCGEELTSLQTAISRHGHGEICSGCGVAEAFHGDFIRKFPTDMMSSDDGGNFPIERLLQNND